VGAKFVKFLAAGSSLELLVEELNRLTLLGSDNAAALLTLLDSRGALDGGQYASAALERCRTSAAAGNAYAQYVMGWVNRKLGMSAEAFRCLKSASVGMFLPAMIDTARFAAGGAGVKTQDPQAALQIMWTAHKMGHRAALTFIARYWMKGAAGWFARLAGLLLYFPALMRAAHYATRHPLSEKIFVLPLKNEPLLRGERN